MPNIFNISSAITWEKKSIWNSSAALYHYQTIILADSARSTIFLSENRKHCRCSP